MAFSNSQDVAIGTVAKLVSSQPDTFFEMDQRKNEFLATLAHELRNPLAPIKNGLQLLALMNLGEEAESVRAMLARQVEQIVHLVDDLLDISRISCGKVLLDKQLCPISKIAEAAVEESSIFIAESNMTLEVIDNSASVCVCGDRSRLIQVVCNLLNNSAKYGKRGGRIQLELAVLDDLAVIRVQDNGIGIASQRLKDIFRMYSQIDDAPCRGAAGLGIGLALVKNLVELHSGSVQAESEGADRGSVFTVKLPLASGNETQTSTATEIARSARSFRILVVDDLRAMRVVTEKLLQKLGHEVQVAENGEVALQKLNSYKPDIVFSDITMPVMSGHELARRIREQPGFDDICLVAMTGYGQSSDREQAFEAGFDRHLTKPVDFQKLRELFNELDSDSRDNSEAIALSNGGFH